MDIDYQALRRAAATDRQRAVIDELEKAGGNVSETARRLGVHRSVVQETIRKTKDRATLQGSDDPQGYGAPVPEPFLIKGVSTLHRIDKETGQRVKALEWTKSNVPLDRQVAALRAAAEAACEVIEPAAPRATPPPPADEDLAVFLAITDYHFGMYAWAEETGDEWNLAIAEEVFVSTIERLAARAGSAAVCYLALMGDLLHTDSLSSKTPTSGHELDSAGRFAETVRVAIRAIRRVVESLRQKYPKLILLVAEGNHDIVSSGIWLPEVFDALYRESPEIEVVKSPVPFHVWEWGQVMVGVHHGHLAKKEHLPMLYAAKYREAWGRCAFHYIHTGHYHHLDEKGYPGVRVMQHTTLAANDAYSSRAGYVPDREAVAIVYHKTRGQLTRVYEPPVSPLTARAG